MKRTRLAWIVLLGLVLLLAFLPGLIVQADFGSNWTAVFFPNDALQGAGVAVPGVLPQINYNWGGSPPNNIPGLVLTGCTSILQSDKASADCRDYFSARFSSTQTIAPGTYQFVAQSDDGVRVTVNGAVIINNFTPHAATTDSATVSITTSPVNITVEYFEVSDQAIIQVQWFLQGQATGVFGFTPTPLVTAAPAITVSVQSVRGLALRSGPYLGASLISVVRQGTEYAPIARNKDEGIYTWYLITVGDHTGWSSGRYLAVTGDPNFPSVQGTVFDQIDGVPDLGVKGVTRSVMNLRRRPSIRTALLEQIPWGAEVSIVGRTIQAGHNFWFQVRYDNKIGWIYAPYVSVRGNINAVPIR
jgi:PA14 domain/Bacterial SH3 domain